MFSYPRVFGVTVGVTLLEYHQDDQCQNWNKRPCKAVCVMMCLAVLTEHQPVCDEHTFISYTALAQRRAVKSNQERFSSVYVGLRASKDK